MQSTGDTFNKAWEELVNFSLQSIRKAADIYLDLIKLIVTISIPLIPLIGILFNSPYISKAKGLLLSVILLLIASIGFGITALIKHALEFKKGSNEATEKLLELSEIQQKGEEVLANWFSAGLQEVKKGKRLYTELDYKWTILQLLCFGVALILLFVSLYRICP